MSQSQELRAYKQWQAFCKTIQEATAIPYSETPAEKQKRINRAKRDYNFFVDYYFPHYAKAPCADFHIKAANKIASDPNIFAVLEWPREHAKSVHADIIIPLWLKIDNQLTGMVLVGKNETDACNQLADLQAEMQNNQRYINDFGIQFNYGNWQDGSFISLDGIEFIAIGRGQSPRGIRNREKRPNYCVIDDIDDDEIVLNPSRVSKTVKWINSSLMGAISIKEGRFVMVGNRIHRKSILANIVGDTEEGKPKNPYIWHSKIYAVVNDVPAWHQNYTLKQLRQRFETMGYYATQREFFHNPIIEGLVFKENWIKWEKTLPLHKYDKIIAYFDPSYKPKTSNDFKAIKIWAKTGINLHCIKAFVRQCSIPEAVKWLYDFHQSLPDNVIVDYYMEDVFLQDMFFEDFDNEGKLRGYILPIRGDKRQKPDKFSRIQAIAPLWERGLVSYSEQEKKNSDMKTGIDQTLSFEKGSATPDDGPDADEGAIWLLNKYGRTQAFQPILGKRKYKNMW